MTPRTPTPIFNLLGRACDQVAGSPIHESPGMWPAGTESPADAGAAAAAASAAAAAAGAAAAVAGAAAAAAAAASAAPSASSATRAFFHSKKAGCDGGGALMADARSGRHGSPADQVCMWPFNQTDEAIEDGEDVGTGTPEGESAGAAAAGGAGAVAAVGSGDPIS